MRCLSIDDGQDLLEALARAVPGLRGWVQASGHVEDVELRIAGEGADPRRRLAGRWTLVSLSGPAAGPFTALVARQAAGESGTTLLAGTLLAARSAKVNAALWEDEPAATSDAPPSGQRSAPTAPPPGASWAEIAAATAAATEDESAEQPTGELPRRGDLVHHFSFGLCEVLSVSGDRLKIRDVRGPGRIRDIFVDALRVIGPSQQDGKRLFKLVRKT